MPKLTVGWGVTLLVASWLSPAWAQTIWTGEPAEADAADGPPFVDVRRPLWFEHRGSFRFRPELIVGGDLGLPQSAVPPPIEALATGGALDEDTLGWASIRLRYLPSLWLGPNLAVHANIDALDNVVLGSTHVNAGGAFDRGLWDDSQAPPPAVWSGWQSSARVRYLYGTWNLWNVLDLGFGRMPDELGLGISRNDGDCLDCDFGTIVDGVRLGLTLYGLRLEGIWEYTATGATTARPSWEGQPKDLGQADDVTTFTVRVESRPVTAADRESRERLLNERRRVAFDFGLFSSFRTQDLSSVDQLPNRLGCEAFGATDTNVVAVPWECWQLVPRDVFIWRPGAWMRLEGRPSLTRSWRIGAEVAGLIGEIDNTLAVVDDQADLLGEVGQAPKDLSGFGGALEAEMVDSSLSFGLDAGFATGDDRPVFGFVDGQAIVVADADDVLARANRDVTAFWFHRDYRVDLILFRQIIGGVTNAIYAKPWIGYSLLDAEDVKVTARLDAMYAAAWEVDGTPGRDRHYGIELDGRLSLETSAGVTASLTGGVLFPMGALDDEATGASPDTVFALRGLMAWTF